MQWQKRNVKVNGRKVDIPSFLVKVGDEIEVKKGIIPDDLSVKPPSWIDVGGTDGNRARILRLPERKDFDLKIDESLIIEFYSR